MAEQKIVNFIRNAIKDGTSLNVIKSQLKKSGWSDRDVNDAIESVMPSATPTPKLYCWNCGTENHATIQNCKHCGVNLTIIPKEKKITTKDLINKQRISGVTAMSSVVGIILVIIYYTQTYFAPDYIPEAILTGLFVAISFGLLGRAVFGTHSVINLLATIVLLVGTGFFSKYTGTDVKGKIEILIAWVLLIIAYDIIKERIIIKK